MTLAVCALMAQYNRWINLRLYDATARLSDAQLYEDRGTFFGSLFDTLKHICVSDTIWLHRFTLHADISWLEAAMTGFPRPTSLRQGLATSLP